MNVCYIVEVKTTNRLTQEVMKKIKDRREELGLDQSDVAAELHVGNGTYGHWETLTRTMAMEYLFHLPQILHCLITDLLPASVVTEEDRERAKDDRLERIKTAWPGLSDSAKKVASSYFDSLIELDRKGKT